MFVEIIVEGVEQPFVLPVTKLSGVTKQLEKRGKNWKFGKTFQ
tara:strand:- start:10079 stop:10207 length:129 start_codon:yes stop_codon:yes gene_type:complete